MKRSRIIAIILCFVLAFASLSFIGCKKNAHNFATTWESDSEFHWHACTDKDCTETADKAKHQFENGQCTVCGKNQPRTYTASELTTNLMKSIADVKKSEGFGATIANALVNINGVEVSISTGENYVDITVDADVVVNFDLFAGRDADGELTVYATANLAAVLKKPADATDLENYQNEIARSSVVANVMLEKGMIYLQVINTNEYDGVPEEYKQYNEKENNTTEMALELSSVIDSMVDEDTPAFVSALIGVVEEKGVYLYEKFNTDLMPVITKAIENSSDIFDKYLKIYAENSINVTKKDGGYSITVNYDKAKEAVDNLLDCTVGEFYDKYFGTGEFDKLPAKIKLLLGLKITDIIDYAESAIELDINQIAAKINEVLAEVLPEDQVTTIEELLELPEGTTVRNYVLGLVGEMTVEDLVKLLVSSSGDEELDVKAAVDQMFATAKDMPMVDVLGSILEQVIPNYDPEILKTQKEEVRKAFKQIIDLVAKTINSELLLNEDGTFKAANVRITLSNEVIETIAAIAGSEPEGMPEINASLTMGVYKGAYRNSLDVKWSEVKKAALAAMNQGE